MGHLETIGIGKTYARRMVPCEVCGGPDFAPLQTYGRIGAPGEYGEMPVHICRRCGFKMTNPRYEDQFYIDYYERLYREVAFGQEKPSQEYMSQQRSRGAKVLAYAQRFVDRPGRMLDHGCASGGTMLAWRDAGWTVRGMDPHRPSVLMGRSEFGLDIEIAAGERLPYADGAFDLALSLGSLEHVYDLNATMLEIRRVLVPGGALVVRWRSDKMFGSPLEYFNHNHYRFFSPRTWALLLSRYGFSLVDRSTEKFEGWDSYDYFIARVDQQSARPAGQNAVDVGFGDDPEEVLRALNRYRHQFRRRCEDFLALAKRHNGDAEAVITSVRAGEVEWGLLGGPPTEVVDRSRMEAERYIAAYDAGRVH